PPAPASSRTLTRVPRPRTASYSFYSPCAHRDLPSFPTRRSSDLHTDEPGSRVVLRQARWRHFAIVDEPDALHTGEILSLCLPHLDRKSTRLNSSHVKISYAVFCLKKKKMATYDRDE